MRFARKLTVISAMATTGALTEQEMITLLGAISITLQRLNASLDLMNETRSHVSQLHERVRTLEAAVEHMALTILMTIKVDPPSVHDRHDFSALLCDEVDLESGERSLLPRK